MFNIVQPCFTDRWDDEKFTHLDLEEFPQRGAAEVLKFVSIPILGKNCGSNPRFGRYIQ
jgi:hypothetical protein